MVAIRRKDQITMQGDGIYASVSDGPRAVVNGLTNQVVASAFETGHVGRSHPFVFADFGSADGLIAQDLITSLVSAIRRETSTQPISIHATDLPTADFRPLFARLASADSYLSTFDNVFASSCGLSFFQPLFPPNGLHLGFSASAMHYLSAVPASLKAKLHSANATGAEVDQYKEQASTDWEAIVMSRSAELAPGGRMIIALLGIDEEGRHLGNTDGHNLFAVYEELWQGLARDGYITADEFETAVFQQHYRTKDEIEKPFINNGIAKRAGCSLVSLRSQVVGCPFRNKWLKTNDDQSFARRFVATHRSWTSTVFENALKNRRDPNERSAIINLLYKRYEEKVLKEPHLHRKDLVHWIVEFEKRG